MQADQIVVKVVELLSWLPLFDSYLAGLGSVLVSGF